MLDPVTSRELDSRSIERIVEHSAAEKSDAGSEHILPSPPFIHHSQNRAKPRPQPPHHTSPNIAYQSGTSSGTSSTERGASYLVAPRSLCDSEHYTDSGIHHTDSNGMEEDQLLQNEREVRHHLGHEQQFGTFGRPNMITSNRHQSNVNPLQRSALAAHSEENLQPIFQPTIEGQQKGPHSRKSSYSKYQRRPFCPDWRCVLMCNMIILSLITCIFLLGFFYIWPSEIAPLLEKTKPIDGQWSDYNSWSECSVSCGSGGSQVRSRYCGSPPPEDGGLDCLGEAYVNRTCSAAVECADCNRVCVKGTLNSDCTKCTCEHHQIIGVVTDEAGNPLANANVYKLGHYDMLALTNRRGEFTLTKICAGQDNQLLVTKEGFNPKVLWPEKRESEKAYGNVAMSILIPPQITRLPQSKIRYVGQGFRLCCAASDNSGEDNFKIEWFKNNEIIQPGKWYNDSQTDLVIPSAKLEDAGIYKCKASNRAGIDLSPEVTVEIKDESYRECDKKPKDRIIKIQPDCDVNQVNIGECTRNAAPCLNQNQFKTIVDKVCLDQPSEYCCGPVKTKKISVACRVAGASVGSETTFKIPYVKTVECGCTKC